LESPNTNKNWSPIAIVLQFIQRSAERAVQEQLAGIYACLAGPPNPNHDPDNIPMAATAAAAANVEGAGEFGIGIGNDEGIGDDEYVVEKNVDDNDNDEEEDNKEEGEEVEEDQDDLEDEDEDDYDDDDEGDGEDILGEEGNGDGIPKSKNQRKRNKCQRRSPIKSKWLVPLIKERVAKSSNISNKECAHLLCLAPNKAGRPEEGKRKKAILEENKLKRRKGT
jgi:hypothetical protein